MKKFSKGLPLLYVIIGFLLVGVSPTFAGDLLGGVQPWPSQERTYHPRVNSETRYSIGGAAVGAILGSILSNNDTIVVGSAVLGGMVGNGMGTRSGAREYNSRVRESTGRDRCRKLYAAKTDPESGENNAQFSVYCIGDDDVEMPMPGIALPAPAVYGKQRVVNSEPSEPKTTESLTPEEKAVLAKWRELKRQETSSSASTGFIRTSTRCRRYTAEGINPNC